jgi:phosphatidylglycerol---prolipoprotein diacylglyceryl transferase
MLYPPHRLPAYGWLMLTGIVVTLVLWTRLAKRDERLLVIYISGLGGAFIGAKLVYMGAEWRLWYGSPYMWPMLATGKSIVGALLGGYAAVEAAKKLTGYRAATGDWFAMLVPVGVLIGRVGCLVQGCCLGAVCPPAWYTIRDIEGEPRWPAVPVEMLFNAIAIIVFFILRRKKMLTGQHFHLYLIGYGLFRFAHEFMRDTPRILGILSGYQIAALAVAALGIAGFERRRRGNSRSPALAAEFQ